MAGPLPVIRRACPEDAEAIAEVHLGARREAMPYLPETHTREETRGWIREVVLSGHDAHVAVEDGKVVGFLALHGAMLEQLYVRRGFQGRGIGSALLDLAKELRP